MTASDALEGLERPAAAFEQALARGRLHHAWLFTGPEGLGKASLAHRAARRLLGARAAAGPGPLASSDEDPVARLIAAEAHPDLIVLERRGEDGKLKKAIAVEDARRLPEFFAKTPGIASCRVAIVDSADDLNASSANALLKTLEEPSGKGVLILISHAPGALLPTIRSRCRVLRFDSWPVEALANFAERRLGRTRAEAMRLAELAGGAPGRLLSLDAAGALALDGALGTLMSRLPRGDEAAALALTDGFRGGEGAARFALVTDLLAERVARATRALAGRPGGDRWAAAWQRLRALADQVETLNLDRADALLDTLADLKSAARVEAAPC